MHEVAGARSSTFWAGLGAVRADAFRSVGGFDERFRRPSIEDIELGYRLVAAGRSLRLDVRFRGRHLKRWTLGSSIVTDIRARGIPWTQLIYRSRALPNDLNTSAALRLSVVLTVMLAASLAFAAVKPWAVAVATVLLATLIGLNFPYYRWFARTRGLLFALRVIPMHLLHHLCNGMSFVAGTTARGRAIRSLSRGTSGESPRRTPCQCGRHRLDPGVTAPVLLTVRHRSRSLDVGRSQQLCSWPCSSALAVADGAMSGRATCPAISWTDVPYDFRLGHRVDVRRCDDLRGAPFPHSSASLDIIRHCWRSASCRSTRFGCPFAARMAIIAFFVLSVVLLTRLSIVSDEEQPGGPACSS